MWEVFLSSLSFKNLPKKRYKTICLDYPWPVEKMALYKFKLSDTNLDYPTVPVEEAYRIPMQELLEPDAHVYFWTTHRFLPVSFDILKSWGLKYNCCLTWVKQSGMVPFGFQFNSEFVLFAKNGSLPHQNMGERVVFYENSRQHSRKPECFFELVKRCSPPPRLEMFARQPREGFDCWGNDTEHFKADGIFSYTELITRANNENPRD